MTGLEPANDGITTHCRNHLATPATLIIRKNNNNNLNIKFKSFTMYIAEIAQLVEQWTEDPRDTSSNLVLGIKNTLL